MKELTLQQTAGYLEAAIIENSSSYYLFQKLLNFFASDKIIESG